ncbi:MAG: hypothetical protein J6V80_03245 [Clostridia bacterium]|nr:hypothetical protein [Clostridia bacterium]
MKKTILDLWYGNTDPQEHREDDPRMRDLLKIMGRNRSELSAALDDKQKETLEKYDDAMNELNCLSEKSIFVYAFRLGMRLAFETLSDENDDD